MCPKLHFERVGRRKGDGFFRHAFYPRRGLYMNIGPFIADITWWPCRD